MVQNFVVFADRLATVKIKISMGGENVDVAMNKRCTNTLHE